MKNLLILRANGGLCNRLRAIGSAYRLTREINASLYVDWFRCPIYHWAPTCGMLLAFRDLFEPIEGVSVREKFHIRNDLPWDAWRYSKMNPYFYDESRRFKLIDDIKNGEPRTRWLWTCFPFYSIPDFSWVKPRAYIQSQIDAMKLKMSDNCIGIHIRRTDNGPAIKGSPLSLFMQKMDDEIDGDSSASFFISSDSPEVKAELKQRYGDRVVYCEGVEPRYTKKGCIDAVVDLFSLANTRKIYGSYWSSFSEVASQIGKIPLEVLVKSDIELPSWTTS